MLKIGTNLIFIWSGLNFILAALILSSVVVFQSNSPLLGMVFKETEVAALDPRFIASLNALTILYNSCSMVVSVMVWIILRQHLLNGQKWAFGVLLVVIGFIEVMAFVASAQVDHARWQVNVIQSILYILGIGLTGFALFTAKR